MSDDSRGNYCRRANYKRSLANRTRSLSQLEYFRKLRKFIVADRRVAASANAEPSSARTTVAIRACISRLFVREQEVGEGREEGDASKWRSFVAIGIDWASLAKSAGLNDLDAPMRYPVTDPSVISRAWLDASTGIKNVLRKVSLDRGSFKPRTAASRKRASLEIKTANTVTKGVRVSSSISFVHRAPRCTVCFKPNILARIQSRFSSNEESDDRPLEMFRFVIDMTRD